MLNLIRAASRAFSTEPVAADERAEAQPERRQWLRLPIWNREVAYRSGQSSSVLRLKDISCGGASGITDLALAPGSYIFLDLPGVGIHSARVQWVRNTTVGLKFVPTLEFRYVLTMFARQGRAPRQLALPSGLTIADIRARAVNDQMSRDRCVPELERS